MRTTKIGVKRQQLQLFCGKYTPTNMQEGQGGLQEAEIERILDVWRKFETSFKWRLIDCKQSVQLFANGKCDLSQQQQTSQMLYREFKRQRVKPDKVVQFDFYPWFLFVGMLAMKATGVTVPGMSEEV